jgi:hypothetical protein
MAQAAPASCVSCGFLFALGGSLGQAFGVCGACQHIRDRSEVFLMRPRTVPQGKDPHEYGRELMQQYNVKTDIPREPGRTG